MSVHWPDNFLIVDQLVATYFDICVGGISVPFPRASTHCRNRAKKRPFLQKRSLRCRIMPIFGLPTYQKPFRALALFGGKASKLGFRLPKFSSRRRQRRRNFATPKKTGGSGCAPAEIAARPKFSARTPEIRKLVRSSGSSGIADHLRRRAADLRTKAGRSPEFRPQCNLYSHVFVTALGSGRFSKNEKLLFLCSGNVDFRTTKIPDGKRRPPF